MKASDRCIDLIREFEGFASECYDDVGGIKTIGYGHAVRKGEAFPGRISESDATRILCDDLESAEACIEDNVDTTLTQNQFDALCCFVFNIGCHAFRTSTMLKKLNMGDIKGAVAEFPKWSRVGSRQVSGLLRRRLAEQLLFNDAD